MGSIGTNRTKLQRQLDRETVARLTLQGWGQTEIAQFLEVDQSTVSRDLKAIQKQWKESSIRDFDLDRQQELQRLAMLEKEFWAAWERSQQSKEVSLNERLATGKDEAGQALGRVKLATRTEQRVGEAAFLNGILNCLKERAKLLGLYPEEATAGQSITLSDGQLGVLSQLMGESQNHVSND